MTSLEHADPWLGGTTERYSDPQRRRMIDSCIARDQVRGCSCPGCKMHQGILCPSRTLAPEVDVYRILTPQHGEKGPGDHHLSNLKAFCQPCNRNTKPTAPLPQHIPHTHAHDQTRAIAARREGLRDNASTSSGVMLNLDHEPDFRLACFEYVLKGVKDAKFRFTRSQIKANAREVSDTGRDAAYSYMERLFASQEGPLTDVDPVTGKKGLVRLKDPEDYSLSKEQLEAKYPKEGRSYAQEGGR